MFVNHEAVLAAGIAFYEVWAFFPGLVALVIIGGTLFGDEAVGHLLSWIGLDLPKSVDIVVVGQLKSVAALSRGVSTGALAGAVVFSFWSAMRGVSGLMRALNAVYHLEETRPFWRREALAFLLSCLGGSVLLIALGLALGMPASAAAHGETIALVLLAPSRWPVLIVLLFISLAIVYRYGPARQVGRLRWVTWGATTSAIGIVLGSFVLSYYTSRFNLFNPLLGSLGGVTLFLLWTYLNVLAILLGAHINAELEGQAK
jgi:membrane protein